MIIKPYEYQNEAINSIFNYFGTNNGNPIVAMPGGCHGIGHPILMYNGDIKKVEDVMVGDLLMGPDSTPRKVLELVRGRQEMRKITVNKGESFIVNRDHKMMMFKGNEGISTSTNKKYAWAESRNEVVTIGEYEQKTEWYKSLRKILRSEIEFPEKQLPLEPYFIGILLGDGSTINGGFNLTTADCEIEDYFIHYVESFGLCVRIEKYINGKASCLNGVDPLANRSRPNRITKILRDIGLQEKRAWEKSIPFEYKTGSRQQRLELLAGLIDTDGFYDLKNKNYQFTSCSEQLAIDVLYLIRSLGFRGRISRYKTTHRDCFSICISGDIEQVPCLLERKQAVPSDRNKNLMCSGFKIEKLPEDDYYGFVLNKDHLYLDGYFIIHHNTGKSVVIGGFIKRVLEQWPNQRILCLTHVQELIAQNHKRLGQMWSQSPAGINSAGLDRRDWYHPVIFAGIQSVCNYPEKFGRIDLILIDEAHLVSDNDSAKYRVFIDALLRVNPYLKVVGFTATPWRQGIGCLTQAGIFTDVCIDLTTPECFKRFIAEGFLSPLIPKKTQSFLDVNGVHMQGGDFNLKELNLAVDRDEITRAALEEACWYGRDRRKWMIFAAGVEHSIHVAAMLNEMGISCKAVHSRLKKGEREQTLEEYKTDALRAVSNNNCLTTGYDNTQIDFIIMLRPTTSVVLWIQMLSRGDRVHYEGNFDISTLDGRLSAIRQGGKQNCLVMDFARNTARLGPINDPKIPRKKGEKGGTAPVKECPGCNIYLHISARVCEHCGQEFTFQTKIETTSSNEEVMSGELPDVKEMKVDHISYSYNHGRGKPDSMKVTYYCGLSRYSEFVCCEHSEGSFPFNKAKGWWKRRNREDAMPTMVSAMLNATTKLSPATHIRVWTNKKPYPDIMSHCFDGSFFGKNEPDPFDIPKISSDGNKFQDVENKEDLDDEWVDDILF